MAARSGKQVTKPTTTRVKKAAVKAAAQNSPSSKKTMKKIKPIVSQPTAPSPKKSKKKDGTDNRHAALKEILLAKREALIQEIKLQLGQSVTEEQQRRLEAAMDSGDQALVDLEREMGISLQEMRNRERQLIDDALDSLDEGTYGVCADCEEEISEKRLHALPFARLCVECQSKRELMEKIERSEQRS
ncbi:MAG: TraR/DksA family transcriptional regulator [Nitrospirales bacterium]